MEVQYRTPEEITADISRGFCCVKNEYRIRSEPTFASKLAEAETAADVKEIKADKVKSRKRRRGQNHNRGVYKPKPIMVDGKRICHDFMKGTCLNASSGNECKFSHNLQGYMQAKESDLGDNCYIFDINGRCDFGITCRFAGAHTINNETYEQATKEPQDATYVSSMNNMSPEFWNDTRTNKMKYELAPHTISALTQWREVMEEDERKEENNAREQITEHILKEHSNQVFTTAKERSKWSTNEKLFRPIYKKQTLEWDDMTYLAPLTTVGNLPFRRICKEYGVDITCGEMALSDCLIKGQRSEWALVKRHSSEKIFGVQICSKQIHEVTKSCELINEHCNVDFVDLNVGCPIDLICKRGMGSSLMLRPARLWDLGRAMSLVLDCPATIKMRKGWSDDKINAPALISQLSTAGITAVSVHGRTRQQRYSKKADWKFIAKKCVSKNENMPRIVGNGDIFTYLDYNKAKSYGVKTVMVGRGALIKPWIFQEIKEQKHWDISSSERFEMLKRFTNYGLEHWGSDSKGVANVRKFLLEWQSFLHRYVPVGLQERPDLYGMTLRPDRFVGRDDLETLMASPNANDWVKLSELLIGKAPDDFHFVPKHKSHSYEQ